MTRFCKFAKMSLLQLLGFLRERVLESWSRNRIFWNMSKSLSEIAAKKIWSFDPLVNCKVVQSKSGDDMVCQYKDEEVLLSLYHPCHYNCNDYPWNYCQYKYEEVNISWYHPCHCICNTYPYHCPYMYEEEVTQLWKTYLHYHHHFNIKLQVTNNHLCLPADYNKFDLPYR